MQLHILYDRSNSQGIYITSNEYLSRLLDKNLYHVATLTGYNISADETSITAKEWFKRMRE